MGAAAFEVADFQHAIEFCHRQGWTDGLPVIPPTRELVSRFIDTVGLAPDTQIGFYGLRNRPITVEKLAINAVMAGCLPEYFPTVLALSHCLLEPSLEMHTASSSTGNLSLGFVVNGPIRKTLEMNCQGNMLGSGNRANASIGRALRLIQINVFGSVGGAGGVGQGDRPILDRATMGSPLRYASFHVVENEEAFPELTPMHVLRGFDRYDSVVSAFSMFSYLMLSNHFEKTPEEWIASLAHYVVGAGRLADGGFGILLLPIEAAKMFVEFGWSKADISRALYEDGRRSVAWVKENGWKIGGRYERGGKVGPGDRDEILSLAGGPEDIQVVVCGGPAGNFPVYVQTYASTFKIISRRIEPAVGAATVDQAIAIREAIEPLRAQLAADGYDIEFAQAEGEGLTFTLAAGPEACADCLVPPAIMTGYVRQALASLPRWREAEIELRYPAGVGVT